MVSGGQQPKRVIGVRHAEKPNQTVNADLCFVPAEHEEAEALPAVSGSSGRLVVSEPKVAETARTWPGKVFGEEGLSYTEAMDKFIKDQEAAQAAKSAKSETKVAEATGQGTTNRKAERLALLSERQQVQIDRRKERARRKLADEAWKDQRQKHQEALAALGKPGKGKGRNKSKERRALKAQRKAEWAVHHRELEQRHEDDAKWRASRGSLREREAGLAAPTVWIAVLVIVDNCTRICPGLPLSTLGAHVTAELVAEALEKLLPVDLRYLITDRGKHFTADVMKALAKKRGFVRVPLAKHRPQSNGIAERFVQTLKEWLADKEWQTDAELTALLEQFVVYYNNRPHQGVELAGLSPNEYAARKVA